MEPALIQDTYVFSRAGHCRANSAHQGQSRPDSGLDVSHFSGKSIETFEDVSFSLSRGKPRDETSHTPPAPPTQLSAVASMFPLIIDVSAAD